jgi:hypothetical protein
MPEFKSEWACNSCLILLGAPTTRSHVCKPCTHDYTQVDAAYEQADILNGRQEAAAIQAAEAAGTTPPPAAAAAGQSSGAAAPGISAGRYNLPSSGNTTADKVAAGLVIGGTVVATAVGKAAAATANAISNYANKQVASGKPNQKPATISPTFKSG